MSNPIAKIAGAVGSVVIFSFLFTVLFGSWYTIDEGHRGVMLRNGAVIGISNPGLGFKFPIVDSVETFTVRDRIITYSDVGAYSRDQQPAVIKISINYRLNADRIEEIYTRYGSEESVVARLIQPRVMSEFKAVFGRFAAVTAIQERDRLNAEVREAITKAIDGPVTIVGVQVEDIDFSDAYEQSIEQRMLAEVEVQRIRQNAEREKVQAEITVTKAKAEADAVRAKAQADADAIRLRGEAEADAIKARGQALRDNPNIIGLVQAERWNGQLPTTMLPGNSVPMLNLQR
jgi:Membrane protease subunits, stomatin/prohibitin homologs